MWLHGCGWDGGKLQVLEMQWQDGWGKYSLHECNLRRANWHESRILVLTGKNAGDATLRRKQNSAWGDKSLAWRKQRITCK